jgi:hypothetical protein
VSLPRLHYAVASLLHCVRWPGRCRHRLAHLSSGREYLVRTSYPWDALVSVCRNNSIRTDPTWHKWSGRARIPPQRRPRIYFSKLHIPIYEVAHPCQLVYSPSWVSASRLFRIVQTCVDSDLMLDFSSPTIRWRSGPIALPILLNQIPIHSTKQIAA